MRQGGLLCYTKIAYNPRSYNVHYALVMYAM